MAIATNPVADALNAAKTQLVEQQQQLETQLEQIRKGIDSIEVTLTLLMSESGTKSSNVAASAKPKSQTVAAQPASTKSRKPTVEPRRKRKGQASWVNYLRDEFQGQTIVEVVQTIARRFNNKPFSTNDLMAQIFEPNMPKDDRAAARNRILNVLSLGATSGKFVRHGTGSYTLKAE